MNQRSFGRSTEKQSSGIFEQLELGFNEPEVLFDLLQPEPTLEEAAPRKKAKGKRASDNYLIHFYDRLKEEMFKQDILHADETSFEVSKDGRKTGS